MTTLYTKLLVGLVLLIINSTQALAALDIELTQGIDSTVPVAVVPFAWESDNAADTEDLAAIIAKDLHNSGGFSNLPKDKMQQFPSQVADIDYQYWRDQKINNLVIGKVQSLSSGQYKVEFALLDLFHDQQDVKSDPVLVSKVFIVRSQDLRRLAHHISDLIYKKLTGEDGIFSTRLAYVLVQQRDDGVNQYTLEISDIDGGNARSILRSPEPIMSPAWSPDGKKLAYVSFEGKRARIFVSEVATGNRKLISQYPGINGAPAWSPDGEWLALALSENASPDIYLLRIADKYTVTLTKDSSINTEPHWAPDGKAIIFTSDRGGSPQIYRMELKNKKIKRITFNGNYNSSAEYLPDGHSIILLHKNKQRKFDIALLNLENNMVKQLTQSGSNESPSLAPNGKMIVYAGQQNNSGVLGIISIDGKVQLHLPAQQGNVQEPAWSPFLQQTSQS